MIIRANIMCYWIARYLVHVLTRHAHWRRVNEINRRTTIKADKEVLRHRECDNNKNQDKKTFVTKHEIFLGNLRMVFQQGVIL